MAARCVAEAERGRLQVMEDNVLAQLPNEFVRLIIPCQPEPALPAGWIPVRACRRRLRVEEG
eukprot:1524903-Rhodomonas_salina.2